MDNNYQWDAMILLYKDKTVLQQLLIAIGLPFGVVVLFLLWVASQSNDIYAWYGLILIGILMLLTVLLIGFVYQNRMHVCYHLNQNRIKMELSEKQKKINSWVNWTTTISGLFAKNPTVMGIGLLASANQRQMMRLVHVKAVMAYPDQFKLVLVDSYRQFLVQCESHNYHDVTCFLHHHTQIPYQIDK
jgi:hypothetical protein